jgi:hypothetical protein
LLRGRVPELVQWTRKLRQWHLLVHDGVHRGRLRAWAVQGRVPGAVYGARCVLHCRKYATAKQDGQHIQGRSADSDGRLCLRRGLGRPRLLAEGVPQRLLWQRSLRPEWHVHVLPKLGRVCVRRGFLPWDGGLQRKGHVRWGCGMRVRRGVSGARVHAERLR